MLARPSFDRSPRSWIQWIREWLYLAFNQTLSTAVLICQQDIGIAPINPEIRRALRVIRISTLLVRRSPSPPRNLVRPNSIEAWTSSGDAATPVMHFAARVNDLAPRSPGILSTYSVSSENSIKGGRFHRSVGFPRDILYIFPTQPCVTPPVPICLHKCRLYLRRNLAHGKGAAHLIHAHD